jgi:hypothetical protein
MAARADWKGPIGIAENMPGGAAGPAPNARATARGPLRAGERLPPEVGDREPGHRDRSHTGIGDPGVAVASPSSTRRPNVSTVKPRASMIASVAPFGAPAPERFSSGLTRAAIDRDVPFVRRFCLAVTLGPIDRADRSPWPWAAWASRSDQCDKIAFRFIPP